MAEPGRAFYKLVGEKSRCFAILKIHRQETSLPNVYVLKPAIRECGKRSRSRRHSRIRFTNDAPKELRRSLTRRLMTSKEISRNVQHRLAAGLEMYSSSHQPDIGYVGSRSETAQQVLTFVLLAVGTNGDRTASRGRLGHVSCHRLSILPAGQHCVLFENSS